MPTPTPHQQAIIEAIAQRSGPSVEVAAGAGCAKSSTLEMAAPGIRVPALALAFNKKIATELKSRLPSNFSPMTLNGLGHRAWMRKLGPGVKIEIDDRKVGKIASEVAKDHGVELQSDQWDGLRQMISKAQQVGLVPEGEQRLGLVRREKAEATIQKSTGPISGIRVMQNAATAMSSGNGRPRTRNRMNAKVALKNASIAMPMRYPPIESVISSVMDDTPGRA